MNFLAPLAFLFAAALPVIVLFYILKLRRSRHEVSSTLLWQRAAEDLQANAPFQKLRRNLLLLLQLLIAALLVFGLARPYLDIGFTKTRSRILLIDHSASMTVADGPGARTRLEEAKARAQEIVRSMRPGDQALVIPFASKAVVSGQATSDQARLRTAIDSIAPTHTESRPAEAFSLAQSLARPVQGEIVVLSDGVFTTDGLSLAPGTSVRFERIGTSSDNAGIVSLDLRRTPEKPDEFQVFAEVRNYFPRELKTSLEVFSNGRLVDVRPVTIPSRGSAGSVFHSSQLQPGRVEIRLAGLDGDKFAADNSAFGVIKPPPTRRILMVSRGNYFLEKAFRNIPGRKYEVVRVAPDAYSAAMRADVVVFDGTTPAELPPSGSYLFINSVPSGRGYVLGGEVESPAIFDWNAQHPLMRYVELSDVQIRRMKKFQVPKATEVLAETREAPLISVASEGNLEVVVWAFDLYETNLPLRMAFPILVSNSIDWLLRNEAPGEKGIARTGEVLQVDLNPQAQRATISDPAGRAWALPTNTGGRVPFHSTSLAGFYTVEVDGKPGDEFGVSLASATESDVAPRDSFAYAGGEIRSGSRRSGGSRELWSWLAAGALIILVLEWIIYHRRVFV